LDLPTALLLLLTLGVSLIALLLGSLRLLLRGLRMLRTFGVITLSVMIGRGAMRLCCILVMFGGADMFVLSHR
jgi:hypothetical protein